MGQGRDVVISPEGVVLDPKPDGSMFTILLRLCCCCCMLGRSQPH